jgi:hypothetical protein
MDGLVLILTGVFFALTWGLLRFAENEQRRAGGR